MRQARYLNADCDIYLLSDEKGFSVFQNLHQDFFSQERIDLVNTDLLSVSSARRSFYLANKLDFSREDGYWTYATERFFVLHDFMKEKELRNVFHLENDTMLYVDLSELFPAFDGLNTRLAAPFQSLKGCIPCFVFIKDAKSLSFLLEHIIEEMKSFTGSKPHILLNDMQTLASFYRKAGADFLMPLPTLMPEYLRYHTKQRSVFVPDNATPLSFLCSGSEVFPGMLFDAAAFGIFINGNDRKYSPQKGPGTIHSRALFNPGFFSFFWGKESKGRNVPYFSFKGKDYRIVNLHFHSKMPADYASYQNPLGEFPKGRTK